MVDEKPTTPKQTTDGISETLGTDICKGLRNGAGEELGDFPVPRLGAFTVFELEPRIVEQFNKVVEAQQGIDLSEAELAEIKKLAETDPSKIDTKNAAKGKKGTLLTASLKVIFDKEGVALMADVLVHVFFPPPPSIPNSGPAWIGHVNAKKRELEKMFDKDSMQTVYAFIIARDFNLTDIMDGFSKRFASMFGGKGGAKADPSLTGDPKS